QRPLSVIVLEVHNPDVVRKVIGKLVTLGPIAPDQPAVTPVAYKGAELWAMLGESDDLRRCLDAQEAGTVLAKAPEYLASSSTWTGDALFATYETAAYREATEQAMAKQREAMRKQMGENDGTMLESMTLMSALPSALPSTVFRDGTGVHWENSAPTE